MRILDTVRQRFDDIAREVRIEHLANACICEADPVRRRELFLQATAEIAARSPQQVERLERARGLRT